MSFSYISYISYILIDLWYFSVHPCEACLAENEPGLPLAMPVLCREEILVQDLYSVFKLLGYFITHIWLLTVVHFLFLQT